MTDTWRDPETQAALVKLAGEGLSAAAIARRLRMTKNTIIGRARRTGVKLQGRSGAPKRVLEAEIDAVVRRHVERPDRYAGRQQPSRAAYVAPPPPRRFSWEEAAP